MDIDFVAPGLERLVDRDPPLDRIAHGLTFGEGPVWDKRTGQLYWVDIIGNTIWKWKPGVGREVVLRPSGHANGMTFDKAGRLTVAGWCNRTIFRFEHDGSITTIASKYDGKKFNSPNDIVVRSDGSVYWTDSAGGLVIPGMVAQDVQRYLDVMGVFRLTPDGRRSAAGDRRLHLSERARVLARRETPVRERYAARADPRVRRKCRRQRGTRAPFSQNDRHRGWCCRRHESRRRRQRVLHGSRRRPHHRARWPATRPPEDPRAQHQHGVGGCGLGARSMSRRSIRSIARG